MSVIQTSYRYILHKEKVMMRKITMTTLFAVALLASVAANAASEKECRQLIRSAGFNPNKYVLVSPDDADYSDAESYEFELIAANEALCGDSRNGFVLDLHGLFFGADGFDRVETVHRTGMFNGGGEEDAATFNFGTVVGGHGRDFVTINRDNAVFDGGPGDDQVTTNFPTAEFYGGPGDDRVSGDNLGLFFGGPGDDFALGNEGVFYGGPGDDSVMINSVGGEFNGGPGYDEVTNFNSGTCTGVEAGCEP